MHELRERLKGVLDEMERMLREGGEGGGKTYMAGDTFTLSNVFYYLINQPSFQVFELETYRPP